MDAILRAKFVDARLTRDGLSAGAREILRDARQSEYSESYPYSSSLEELLLAMDERAYIDGGVENDAGVDDEGRRFLRYDGTYHPYWLYLR